MKNSINLFGDKPNEVFDFIKSTSLLTQWEEYLYTSIRKAFFELSLQDCIVYVKDSGANRYVQRYILGQKVEANKKDQLFTVKSGQGIVGSVIETGHAEIISNTASDERYIMDDRFRYSEMTVPLFFQNNVIGAIDAEHITKDFFTSGHLACFVNIARKCECFLVQKYNELSEYMNNRMMGKMENDSVIEYRNTTESKLMIPSSSGFRIVDPQSIIYLKAEGSYTKIYLQDKTTVLATKNMKEYETKLPVAKFIRVHNSYVINIDHLYGFDKILEEFHLHQGHRVPVSVRRKQAVLERLVH